MLFIRHSHRLDNPSWEEMMKQKLTAIGRDTAYEVGLHLPSGFHYRISHSPIERCGETAKEIFQGLTERHQIVEMQGKNDLLSLYFGNPEEIGKLAMRDNKQFIAYWIAGAYPPSAVKNYQEYIQKSAKILWDFHLAPTNHINRSIQPQQPRMDIFVTHDFNLLGWLFGWGGIYQVDAWVEYLEAFALEITPQELIFYHRDQCVKVPLPYWYHIDI